MYESSVDDVADKEERDGEYKKDECKWKEEMQNEDDEHRC